MSEGAINSSFFQESSGHRPGGWLDPVPEARSECAQLAAALVSANLADRKPEFGWRRFGARRRLHQSTADQAAKQIRIEARLPNLADFDDSGVIMTPWRAFSY